MPHTCDSFVRVIPVTVQLPHRTHRWQLRPLSRRIYPTRGLQACFREETTRVTLHGGVSTSSASLICLCVEFVQAPSCLLSIRRVILQPARKHFYMKPTILQIITSRADLRIRAPVPTWTYLGTINPSSNFTAP